MPEKPHSFCSFWGHSLKESFSVGWTVLGALGTLMPDIITFVQDQFPLVASIAWVKWVSGRQSELRLVIALTLIAIYLFVAPYKFYKKHMQEKQNEIEKLKSAIATQPTVVPLEIETLPAKEISPKSTYECDIQIVNPNQGVTGIELKLVKIEPPLRHYSGLSAFSANNSGLDFASLSLKRNPNGILQKNQKDFARLVLVIRGDSHIEIRLGTGEDIRRARNSFVPEKIENGTPVPDFMEYTLTLEVSANSLETKEILFKMRLSLDSNKPAVTLEKIT